MHTCIYIYICRFGDIATCTGECQDAMTERYRPAGIIDLLVRCVLCKKQICGPNSISEYYLPANKRSCILNTADFPANW